MTRSGLTSHGWRKTQWRGTLKSSSLRWGSSISNLPFAMAHMPLMTSSVSFNILYICIHFGFCNLKCFNPFQNPTDCWHNMLASPPWPQSKMQVSPLRLWSFWWRARHDCSQSGGKPTKTVVKIAASLPWPLSLMSKSHLQTSPSNINGWQARWGCSQKNWRAHRDRGQKCRRAHQTGRIADWTYPLKCVIGIKYWDL